MGIELREFLFEGLLQLLKGDTVRRKRAPEYAYVASLQGNSISSLVRADDRWKSIEERMPLKSPTYLVRSQCGRFLYVASSLTDTVSAFRADDGGTLVRLNNHSSDKQPESMAACPAGRFLYVGNSLGSSVSVFALDRNGMLSPPKSYPTKAGVHDVAHHPKEPLLCLCQKEAGNLTFMSVTEEGELQEVATVDAGTEPSVARWSRDGSTLFVLNAGLGISVWKPCTSQGWRRVAFFPTGRGTCHFTLGSRENRLYVARATENEIAVYDLEGARLETRQLVDCPGGPKMLSISSDGEHLLAACVCDEMVTSFRLAEGGRLQSPNFARLHSPPLALA